MLNANCNTGNMRKVTYLMIILEVTYADSRYSGLETALPGRVPVRAHSVLAALAAQETFATMGVYGVGYSR